RPSQHPGLPRPVRDRSQRQGSRRSDTETARTRHQLEADRTRAKSESCQVLLVARGGGDGLDVLVTAARQRQQGDAGVRIGLHPGQSMRWLECWHDAFATGEQEEGVKGVGVADGYVLHPAAILEESVLGSDTRVVEAGRNTMRVGNLPT